MPLTIAKPGEIHLIKKVGGKEGIRRFLENLGFTAGTEISIILKTAGNLIVQIKESRIALDKEMAGKIII